MRAFISVDLEGMPYIVTVEHLLLKRALYDEARNIATEITSIVCEALHEEGVDEIVVADSHGPMVNIRPEKIPDYVHLIRGYPRPLSMVTGGFECDMAIFLGYHAKPGTMKSTFDHTYSGRSFHKVKINGVEVSEYLLNAYVLGYRGVPVVMVAGDDKLIEEVMETAPWIETVVLKKSYGRYSAQSPSMRKLREMLTYAAKRSIRKFNEKRVKPLIPSTPVNVEISFTSTGYADVAELLPKARRINGLTVSFQSENIEEAYKTIELIALACAGVRSEL